MKLSEKLAALENEEARATQAERRSRDRLVGQASPPGQERAVATTWDATKKKVRELVHGGGRPEDGRPVR